MTASIQAKVIAAFRVAGEQVQFQSALVGGNPWDTPAMPSAALDLWARVESYTARELASTAIRSSDKKVLLEAGQVVPRAGDSLTIRGNPHRIESAAETNLAGMAVMYECQAREG